MRLTGTLATGIVCFALSTAFAQDHDLAQLTQLDSGTAEKTKSGKNAMKSPAAPSAVPADRVADGDNAGLKYEAATSLGMIN